MEKWLDPVKSPRICSIAVVTVQNGDVSIVTDVQEATDGTGSVVFTIIPSRTSSVLVKGEANKFGVTTIVSDQN